MKKLQKYVSLSIVTILFITILLASTKDFFNAEIQRFYKNNLSVLTASMIISFIAGIFGFARMEDFFEKSSDIIFTPSTIAIFVVQLCFGIDGKQNVKSLVNDLSISHSTAVFFILSPTILYILSRPFKRLIRIEKKIEQIIEKDNN